MIAEYIDYFLKRKSHLRNKAAFVTCNHHENEFPTISFCRRVWSRNILINTFIQSFLPVISTAFPYHTTKMGNENYNFWLMPCMQYLLGWKRCKRLWAHVVGREVMQQKSRLRNKAAFVTCNHHENDFPTISCCRRVWSRNIFISILYRAFYLLFLLLFLYHSTKVDNENCNF